MGILSSIGQGDRYFKDMYKKYNMDPNLVSVNEDGSIDYGGCIDLNKRSRYGEYITDVKRLDFPFRLNHVYGSFLIDNYLNLESLEGCPKIIDGNLTIKNSRVETLQGCPKEVGGYFSCSGCDRLKTLEGGPERVGGRYYCNNCCGLKNLKGAPKTVRMGSFNCNNCTHLETLEGIPQKVYGLNIKNCPLLLNLDYFPNTIDYYFDCMGTWFSFRSGFETDKRLNYVMAKLKSIGFTKWKNVYCEVPGMSI